MLLPKARWNRWIVSNPAQNQYGSIIQMIYLLSVDHGIIHCLEHRTGLVLFGYCVLIFFSSVVALRCRISVAVCGSNFRRMRASARVTDDGCGPDISLFICTKLN